MAIPPEIMRIFAGDERLDSYDKERRITTVKYEPTPEHKNLVQSWRRKIAVDDS